MFTSVDTKKTVIVLQQQGYSIEEVHSRLKEEGSEVVLF